MRPKNCIFTFVIQKYNADFCCLYFDLLNPSLHPRYQDQFYFFLTQTAVFIKIIQWYLIDVSSMLLLTSDALQKRFRSLQDLIPEFNSGCFSLMLSPKMITWLVHSISDTNSISDKWVQFSMIVYLIWSENKDFG